MPDPLYPDVEDALIVLLEEGAGGPEHIDTATDQDLRTLLPFTRVNRFAGTDDGITDVARVTIDVFAATRSSGKPIADAHRATLTAAPHAVDTAAGRVVIDEARTESAPTEVPYPGDSVRLWTSSYRITLRRRTGA